MQVGLRRRQEELPRRRTEETDGVASAAEAHVQQRISIIMMEGSFIVTTPKSLSFRTLAQWLHGLNPNSYHPFRCFGAHGQPTTETADANCSMHIGHTKEYTPNELHGAFVNAGFQIIDAQTFSPYFYQLGAVRQNMSLRPSIWKERGHGEVHFVVGRKVGCHRARPCRRGYVGAYEFDDVITEADPLFVPSVEGRD